MNRNIVVALSAGALLSSCIFESHEIRTGKTISRSEAVGEWEKVVIEGPAKVIFGKTQDDKIEISGDSGIVCLSDISTKKGTLRINVGKKIKRTYPSMVAWTISDADRPIVVVPSSEKNGGDSLKKIEVVGSASVELDTLISPTTIKVTGSGSVRNAHIRSQKAKLTVVGSGSIDCTIDSVSEARVEVVGDGEIDVVAHGCKKISANVVGGGKINIDGSVDNIDRKTTGSGTIKYNSK